MLAVIFYKISKKSNPSLTYTVFVVCMHLPMKLSH